MTSFLDDTRASGILAHLTSLPGPYGIGDIGAAARSFIDFLARAGQKYWQILPTVPTNLLFDSSPYMSSSAFAGSPLLVCPQGLHEMGLLSRAELAGARHDSPFRTDYAMVQQRKKRCLEAGFARFAGSSAGKDELERFAARAPWARDYALFMSLKETFADTPWHTWPTPLARRRPAALTEARRRHRDRIDYYLFEQFVFSTQWQALRQYAAAAGLRLIGDIPIYVGLDSSDVWAHPQLFELDPKSGRPLRVAGVPPDYFSATGQRWGNPLYRWNSGDDQIDDALLNWWVQRFRAQFALVDVARVDHFRGLEAYWAIPAEEETAVNGTWEPGPGSTFFTRVFAQLGGLNIIAEDLGEITPAVIKLKDSFNFPGMKVLQFAFDGNPANEFLPHNFASRNCVVYTGTHDNDTTLGWFLSANLDDDLRTTVKQYANRTMHDSSPINRDMIYLAFASTACLAVIPLQDLLGFGSDCRMNTPGVATGNWRWRCAAQYLTEELADDLRALTARFGR